MKIPKFVALDCEVQSDIKIANIQTEIAAPVISKARMIILAEELEI